MVAPFIPPPLCESVLNLTVTHGQSGPKRKQTAYLTVFKGVEWGATRGKTKRGAEGRPG